MKPRHLASPLPSVTDVKRGGGSGAVVICVEPIVVRSATSLMIASSHKVIHVRVEEPVISIGSTALASPGIHHDSADTLDALLAGSDRALIGAHVLDHHDHGALDVLRQRVEQDVARQIDDDDRFARDQHERYPDESSR
jgi:hypothetical protein